MSVCKVLLDEKMPAVYAGEIEQLSTRYLSNQIAVDAESPRHAADIVAISTIAGAAFTALMLIDVAIRRYQEFSAEGSWSVERLESVVAEELAEVGVINFEIVNLTGYEHLREKVAGVCSVQVREKKTGKSHTVYVTPEGDSYRLTIE